ncbi:MAG TPA: cytochrome c oxidase subunit II [Gaiellaceae bacterium]|nr:cytochrome c oxidase subunit II [Gaiellaceae bacterium]
MLSALVATLVSGCGGNQDSLNPHSHAQGQIVQLWWVMAAGSAIGFVVIAGLLYAGWTRRSRQVDAAGERRLTRLVVVLGIAVPVVVLSALFVWADVLVIGSTAAPPKGSAQLTIRVIAHQWWWEVRYPGTTAVTANEIHVPTNTRVDVLGTSADVIHSFWVPELNRKIDLIPGLTNSVLIDATRAGRYRGQCSEFCGVQHAHMAVAVVAQPPAQFRAWLANMARPVAPPATAVERRGLAMFLSTSCASCHTLRGTSAGGDVGPDLTHLATRTTLAALTIPNTPAYLRGWIADPQAVKPGAKMPAVPLAPGELDALVAYLGHLR